MHLAGHNASDRNFNFALRPEQIEQHGNALLGGHDARNHGAQALERPVEHRHFVAGHDFGRNFDHLVVARELTQLIDDVVPNHRGQAAKANHLGHPHG